MTATETEQIELVSQSIFSTMLGIELAQVGAEVPESHDGLIASVQITGGWDGSVVLALPPEMVASATSAMLGLSESDQSAGDQEDVAAELANMIGGNLKSLLPGPSNLSLPTVVSGREFNMRVPGAEQVENVSLACESGAINVRVYEKIESAC